jgi:hypothetical protein
MGIGSYPGLKRQGCAAEHRSPTGAEVKEKVKLYLDSPSGYLSPVLAELDVFVLAFGV